MARTPKKPKPPISDPMIDLFADSPTAARRRPGRRSNLDKDPFAGQPIPNKKTSAQKKAAISKEPGTVPAKYISRDNIDNMSDSLENIDSKDDSPILLDNIEEIVKELNSKDKLTIQELKFIEYHLILKYTVKRSMMLAGYRLSSEGMYFYRAKKIIGKFEARAEDHRQIMRALGAGEVFVIESMFKLAKSAQSEIVKKGALDSLAKWLDMEKDKLQRSGGVTVIIQALDGSQQQVNLGGAPSPSPTPGQAPYQHPRPLVPGQPITITD